MSTIGDIYNALFTFAPASMKMSWDNVGLLCGHMDREVRKVLVALDCSTAVIEEAKMWGAQLIVTHHPLIFGEIKAVNDQTPLGRSLLTLIESGIAAINLHTNLDVAPGGVNDILAARLGLSDVTVLDPMGQNAEGRDYGLIHTGYVNQTELPAFASFVKSALHCPGLRYASGGKPVHHVAVGGGSCGDFTEQLQKSGCDTFVTADVKYHEFLDAEALGINLIDAGHFATENPSVSTLCGYLSEKIKDVRFAVSSVHGDPALIL